MTVITLGDIMPQRSYILMIKAFKDQETEKVINC